MVPAPCCTVQTCGGVLGGTRTCTLYVCPLATGVRNVKGPLALSAIESLPLFCKATVPPTNVTVPPTVNLFVTHVITIVVTFALATWPLTDEAPASAPLPPAKVHVWLG